MKQDTAEKEPDWYSFADALKDLGIEDYEHRIVNSSSSGHAFHLWDYMYLAERKYDKVKFRDWFVGTVKYAEENWQRPESVFQHMLSICDVPAGQTTWP